MNRDRGKVNSRRSPAFSARMTGTSLGQSIPIRTRFPTISNTLIRIVSAIKISSDFVLESTSTLHLGLVKVTQVRVILTTVPRASNPRTCVGHPCVIAAFRHISEIPSQPARVARERVSLIDRQSRIVLRQYGRHDPVGPVVAVV